jgi:DNA repair protein SbcD/Mre11
LRVLHTADWHLGQTLHGVPRTYEHARFLDWLLGAIEREAIDALVIAGDIFDAANPGPIAQAAYYRFLAGCRARHPGLSIAIVGGNHDSPQRLDAPREILGALEIHVMGGLDRARAIVPLRRRDGSIGARLVAVPFLKRGDLPLEIEPAGEEDAPAEDEAHRCLVDAYRVLYRELVDRALVERRPGEALIATGHCYMTGGLVSELSERKIQVGNQHALPVDIFPRELGYVALGHLHRAQSVEGRENVRYSGSPIPLSLAERTYEHQVLIVDVGEDRLERVRALPVPRAVEMLSIPEAHAPIADALAALRALPIRDASSPEETRPFLEVKVSLDSAKVRLRQDIEEALADKQARLLRIDARFLDLDRPGHIPGERELCAISPEEVFKAAYRRQRSGDPPSDLVRMFNELAEDVERARGEERAP